MNIHTVAQNLRNTIAGKEEHLAAIRKQMTVLGRPDDETIAMVVTSEFLKINIDELRRILQDVEQCCEQHSEMGWQLNPERMGQ